MTLFNNKNNNNNNNNNNNDNNDYNNIIITINNSYISPHIGRIQFNTQLVHVHIE